MICKMKMKEIWTRWDNEHKSAKEDLEMHDALSKPKKTDIAKESGISTKKYFSKLSLKLNLQKNLQRKKNF